MLPDVPASKAAMSMKSERNGSERLRPYELCVSRSRRTRLPMWGRVVLMGLGKVR